MAARSIALLLLPALVATADAQSPSITNAVERSVAALQANNLPEAARACAEAVAADPLDAGAQACTKALSSRLPALVAGGVTLLAAGDIDRAREWCHSAAVLDPEGADALKCATTAGQRLATRAAERATLAAVEDALGRGDVAAATKGLADFTSDVPAHQEQAARLRERLQAEAGRKADAVQRANLAEAQMSLASGDRTVAATKLAAIVASDAGSSVRAEAAALLDRARPSWLTPLADALQAPWILQVVAGMLTLGTLWLGLHATRNAWRWIEPRALSRWHPRRPWRFIEVIENGFSGRGAILDALRRVPREVAQPIWTPTRLLLYRGADSWQVWEDFAIRGLPKAKSVHEPSFQMLMSNDGPNAAFANAFENLQFSVGGVGISGVAQLWSGLREWWRAGERTVSGSACQVTFENGTKHIIVRLTASDDGVGTVAVSASTEDADGVDAVALSAERAAYKLLASLSTHEDSAVQIDAHAAYRQGVTAMHNCLRLVVDAESAREHRAQALIKTIRNLEFVRQTFGGDTNHRVYFLEAVRLEAIAYAVIGREGAARKLLEDLELATRAASTPRERMLNLDATYNLAMLRRQQARTSGSRWAFNAATELLAAAARNADAGLRLAVRVWQLTDAADRTRQEWLQVDPADAQRTVQEACALCALLDEASSRATCQDAREYAVLLAQARRAAATVQLKSIAATQSPPRAPFGIRTALPSTLRQVVERALQGFECAVDLPLPPDALTAKAYGLLLVGNWRAAEELATHALAAHPGDQFAVYVAAEAALQQGDVGRARALLEQVPRDARRDPAIAELQAAPELNAGLVAA